MNFAEGSFTGKVIAITGGASGMGAACARAFAELGGTVAIIDVDEARALEVASEIAADDPIIGDVSDSEFCAAAIQTITDKYRRLDVLVNAAGTIHRSDALGTSDDDWRRVMGTNIDGMFYLSRAAVDYMSKRGRGAIVNFGSIWGGVASKGSTAYCVSKGAVHQLTKAMALDHVEQGIRINAVAPGEVRTPMLLSYRDTPPTEEQLQRLADATVPMKRLADPAEIANVVVFLASNDASYMTGEIVHVDGGYTAR